MAHDGVTLAECARHFDISEQQLEHDLWLLVVCGLPGYGPDQLVDIQFWDDGRIHVIDPQTLGRPLRLTSEEATTLLIALRMLAQLPGVEDRDAVLSAAAKLEDVASARGTARYVAIDVAVPDTVREAVDASLAQHRELTITYAAATRDEVTSRTVRPKRLLSVDGVNYLEAYCLSAEALRTFRLDRIMASELGGPFVQEPDSIADVQAPAASGDLPTPPTRTATLLLEPEARWIADVHHAVPLGEPDNHGCLRVQLPLHSLEWGVRLVLSLRGGARVLEPAELVSAVADAAEAALAAYPDRVG
jgi:proteasome accessory factor C